MNDHSASTKPFDIGIHCGHFLSMATPAAEVTTDIFIGIRAGMIAEVSPWRPEKKSQALKFIDAAKFAALPGLINAHTHLAMTLFRGLQDDVPLEKWLFERILPLEAELVDAEFVRIGTELAMLECIRFGVTTVADMYFYAQTAAEVVDRMGLRAWIAQVWADAPLPEDRELGRDKGALFAKLHEKYKSHDRITAALGPHAPYSCSDETLKRVLEISEQFAAPIHIHVCETAHEVEASIKQFGVTPVKRLADLGVLTERTLCAHCVHLSDADIEIFSASGAAVSYNPDSNMKLSSGAAPITQYLRKGIRVGFGTDGAASNNDLSLFGAMDIGTKLQKLACTDSTAMTAIDALACATIGSARALGLDKKVGSLEVGKCADLVLVDLEFPHLLPLHDLRSQLVYSAQGLEVDTVICQGRILLSDKKFVGLDHQRIYSEAHQLRAKTAAAVARLESRIEAK